MIKRIAYGLCVALLQVSSLPVATAATTKETVAEPVTGFTRGANPEWSAPHLEAHEDREDHRRYHQMMEQSHRDWLDAQAEEKGTETYDHEYRMLRARLNDGHRQAHEMSAEWHFEFGRTAPVASTSGSYRSTVVKKPVHVPTEVFVRTGRPTVTRMSRREVKRAFYERVAAEIDTALRPVKN